MNLAVRLTMKSDRTNNFPKKPWVVEHRVFPNPFAGHRGFIGQRQPGRFEDFKSQSLRQKTQKRKRGPFSRTPGQYPVHLISIPEGPSTQYLWTLVPNTIKGMVFGTRDLKHWVLGPSGYGTSHRGILRGQRKCQLQQPGSTGLLKLRHSLNRDTYLETPM